MNETLVNALAIDETPYTTYHSPIRTFLNEGCTMWENHVSLEDVIGVRFWLRMQYAMIAGTLFACAFRHFVFVG